MIINFTNIMIGLCPFLQVLVFVSGICCIQLNDVLTIGDCAGLGGY